VDFDEMSKGEDDDDFPSSAEEGNLFQPSADETTDAEHIPLCLPSLFGQAWCNSNAAKDLAKAELHLREG
jgi:hypothetical protein